MVLLRQGSKERDSSSSPARSSPVMLRAAKQLAADGERPFALRRRDMVRLSNCHGLFFTFEPCLTCIIACNRHQPKKSPSLSVEHDPIPPRATIKAIKAALSHIPAALAPTDTSASCLTSRLGLMRMRADKPAVCTINRHLWLSQE